MRLPDTPFPVEVDIVLPVGGDGTLDNDVHVFRWVRARGNRVQIHDIFAKSAIIFARRIPPSARPHRVG
jgi:hypothetical protein